MRIPASAGGGACDGVHNCYGPYPINVGASAGCPLGATCDASYSTLASACTAAGTGTLYLTRTWSGLTTQSLACNIYALANGIIKPASGQTVSLTKSFDGSLTQHFDLSSSGLLNFSSAKISAIYPQWFGALCAGVDDTVAVQNTVNVLTSGKKVKFVCGSTISSLVSLPVTAIGGIIEGVGPPKLTNPGASGPTLIAKSGSAAFLMFGIYAESVHIIDFGLDGNNTATSGPVFSGALGGVADNVWAANTLGDGIVISPNGPNNSGNNDSLTLNHPACFKCAGWGLRMLQGSDNNNVTIRDPWYQQANNGVNLGGELLSGSKGLHVGGHYEGLLGPAVQMGALDNSHTFFWTIFPLQDLENDTDAHNAVSDVCGQGSMIYFNSASEFIPYVASPGTPTVCSLFGFTGVLDTGFGSDTDGGGFPRLSIKTVSGTIPMEPGASIQFRDSSGTVLNTFAPPSDTTDFTGFGGPFFVLNSHAVNATGWNYIASETGANNAIAGALVYGPSNTAVPLEDGLVVTVRLAHTLAAATPLSFVFNGTSKAISNNCDPTTFTIGKSFAVNGFITMVFSGANNVWEAFGVCP